MKLNQRGAIDLMSTVIIVLVMAIGGFMLYRVASSNSDQVDIDQFISSYEECAAAGYPIMESYPEQCGVPGGKTFVRELTPEELDGIGQSNSSVDKDLEDISRIPISEVATFSIPKNWHSNVCLNTTYFAPNPIDLPNCQLDEVSIFSIHAISNSGEVTCSNLSEDYYENESCGVRENDGQDIIEISYSSTDVSLPTGYFKQNQAVLSNGSYDIYLNYRQYDKNDTYRREFTQLVDSVSFY